MRVVGIILVILGILGFVATATLSDTETHLGARNMANELDRVEKEKNKESTINMVSTGLVVFGGGFMFLGARARKRKLESQQS